MEDMGLIRDLAFFKNKRILLTGHTGFKGAWLCKILTHCGADVIGYALEMTQNPNLFSLAGIGREIDSHIGDIRDYSHLKKVFDKTNPEIVVHMAAQPIVRESYKTPRLTYETNVMGTVNLLECVRQSDSVRSVLNVTTDKVYYNAERAEAFCEDEPLDGFDPYSNSKSCSELVTHSYNNSFFINRKLPVSTARAGNVIGGGDFADGRIIPDCVSCAISNKTLSVRNPDSIRPYQHVLEPLSAYLRIVQKQYESFSMADYYNVGPDGCDCVTTAFLVELFYRYLGKSLKWIKASEVDSPHEAHFLKLDSSKIKNRLGWKPKWHISGAVKKTVDWVNVWQAGENVNEIMFEQINEYWGNEKNDGTASSQGDN